MPLRTQLLAGFAVVALVALIAGGAAVTWQMLDYRAQATSQRLRDAAMSANGAARALERQGLAPDALAEAIAGQSPLPAARVLILDSTGTVIADSSADDGTTTLADLTWPEHTAAPEVPGYLLVAAPPPPERSGGRVNFPPDAQPPADQPQFGARQGQVRVVLAMPRSSLPSAWQELAPGLAIAISVALLSAAGVAWLLAGAIVKPLRAVTHAAQRLARGEPHAPLEESGSAEAAQLARSFNAMVDSVERSQRTLREFVANASHELRTPLTAIQGFSQAVAEGVLDAPEETREGASHIHREAERMRRLVEDLLLLSRVEARDVRPAHEEVDLTDLLEVLTQRIRPAAHAKSQTVRLDAPEAVLTLGDRAQLEHLFGNLLENAVKYAPDGARVTVTGQRAGPDLLVSVHNTGSYICPEDQPHVFERFFRVDRSRARTQEDVVHGSGLGLAIAKEVALRHGGDLTVRSDREAGTEFTVRLHTPGGPLTARDQTSWRTRSDADAPAHRPTLPLPAHVAGRAGARRTA